MRKIVLWSLAVIVGSVSAAAAAGPDPKTEDQKILYAIGLALSRNIAQFSLTDAELEYVKAGLTDATGGKDQKVDLTAYLPKIQELQKTRMAAAAVVEKKAGQAYLEKAAAEKGATKTASGLIITSTKAGNGASPKATDKVKVHYTGKLIDGTVFDSSVQRNEPAVFQLNQVIPCWTEAVQLMKVGGKAKVVCPSEIAYGDRGAPPKIKPGSTLVFDVELLEIVK